MGVLKKNDYIKILDYYNTNIGCITEKEFIHKNDIGNEYFYGDRFKMVNIIYDICHRKEIEI